MQKTSFFYLFVFILAWIEMLQAQDSCKVNICAPYTYQAVDSQSLCKGKRLPKDRVRLKARQRLECTSNSDSYLRNHQDLNFDEWAGMGMGRTDKREARFEMQKFRARQQEDVKWQGQIRYNVVEVWEWEECYYGTDIECGDYTVCEEVEQEDGSTREECMTYTCSCWHDVTRHESRHCSSEVMSYEGEFVRPDYGHEIQSNKIPVENPSTKAWNPDHKDYYDIIPNKYDLLRGETEILQTYSNREQSTSLRPYLHIGDAWNDYSTSLSIDGSGDSVQCRQGASHHLTVKVNTIGRPKAAKAKRSPNPFRVPLDIGGEKMDIFGFQLRSDSDGNLVKAKPSMIRLMDIAGQMLETMSEQSQEFNVDVAKAKITTDQLGNLTEEERQKSLAKSKAFLETTTVRIKLRQVRWGLDREMIDPYKVNELDVKISDGREFLDGVEQDVSLSEIYEIDLNDEFYVPSSYLGALGQRMAALLGGGKLEFRPGEDYYFQVSAYRKGIPFYLQSCKDDPTASWACDNWFTGRTDDDVFSKPFVIDFKAPESVDSRSFYRRINDFIGDKLK